MIYFIVPQRLFLFSVISQVSCENNPVFVITIILIYDFVQILAYLLLTNCFHQLEILTFSSKYSYSQYR